MGKFPQSETAKTYGSIRNINYEDNIIEGLITPEPVLERKAKLT
ncbi:hypothetical protein ACXIHB_10060 [Tenacibaculum sp. IMCC1]|uniref:Uncharacterized protein n=1 Tax=Tenacibaculum sp. Pbs-1 TaxID=3238748 RepID=A0AB33KYH1_9FLAO